MIDRRAVTIGVISGIMTPTIAAAQTTARVAKIGVLNLRADAVTIAFMRPAWQKLGYVEGQTILLRAAEGDGRRFPRLTTDLIAEGAQVLIAVGAEAVRAANEATNKVPIVAIDLETDPVRAGLARSIARPGGNVTGLFLDLPSLAGKWVELLQELVRDVQRVALSWDPKTGTDQLDVAKVAALSRGLEVAVLEAGTFKTFEDAFAQLEGAKRTALIQLTSPGFGAVATRFAAAAEKHRIPTVAFLKSYVRAGVLLAYGPNEESYFPRAVIIADKIVNGAKPAELAIELPSKFDLAINLKTAKALGLTVSPLLLARADEVVE